MIVEKRSISFSFKEIPWRLTWRFGRFQIWKNESLSQRRLNALDDFCLCKGMELENGGIVCKSTISAWKAAYCFCFKANFVRTQVRCSYQTSVTGLERSVSCSLIWQYAVHKRNLIEKWLKTAYLVDPASSLCLSQSLSHACLSTSPLLKGRNRERLIISVRIQRHLLWAIWSFSTWITVAIL